MFSRWLWKKQLLLYSHRYIIKALMGQQMLTALCHDVGCGQPLPAPANEPAVQADRRAEHLPQPHSFFSPNPWPKALAQSPLSFFPVPSPHWPQPAPGTGLVSFSSPFLYNVCIFFSAPLCISLAVCALQRCLPHSISPLFLHPLPIFLCPVEMTLAASGLLCSLPISSAQLLLGLPSHTSPRPPTMKSSSTTASLYLHLLQGNLLLPRGCVRLKRTQGKVEIWVSLLYQQVERSFSA